MRENNENKTGVNQYIPLTEAPKDVPLSITAIQGGRGAQSQLASMGILPGEVVKVIQRENGGPLLVEVKGTRVALGRGISQKVTVSKNGVSE